VDPCEIVKLPLVLALILAVQSARAEAGADSAAKPPQRLCLKVPDAPPLPPRAVINPPVQDEETLEDELGPLGVLAGSILVGVGLFFWIKDGAHLDWHDEDSTWDCSRPHEACRLSP
jgi:hypothetical protein